MGWETACLQGYTSRDMSNYEEDMEYEERAEYVVVRANVPKRGTRKPSYMPPPPPDQPQVDARVFILSLLHLLVVRSRTSL